MTRTPPSPLKLTDTQLVLLSAAAQRDDRSLACPETMPARVFTRALNALLRSGLVEPQLPADSADDRRQPENAGNTYRVTAEGLAAIGIEPLLAPEAHDVAGDREPQAPDPADPAAPARRSSKRALIIDLLSRAQGASIADLMAATGWLPHTTRAALTGLRHKGFPLERTRPADSPSVYRIVDGAQGQGA